ncbi:MAG: 50S ribosomal protein L21e [archaeon]
MVKFKKKGSRAKTRKQLTKKTREKGMPNITKLLQEFEEGDKVHVKPDSSVTSGLPYKRFFGKTGEVTGKQGKCYIVELKDQKATKKQIIHPAHLKKQEKSKKSEK